MGAPGLARRTVVCSVLTACPTLAAAQAWVPPRGEASFSFGVLHDRARDHLDFQGARLDRGRMYWASAANSLGYGVTDRLALRVSLPVVFSRYSGEFPHRTPPGRELYDDGQWHRAVQDFRLDARFKTTNGPLVVTPFVAVVLPSHTYEYLGHAAAGRSLKEAQAGVYVGRVLDPLLPDAYVQAHYAFTVPERVLGIWHNRSDASLDVGYLATPALTVGAFGSWVKTHGGWRTIDYPRATDPRFEFHDQLTRTEYFRLGGSVSYALTGSIDVAASAFTTLSGRNDVAMTGFGLGLTYGFSPAQIFKKRAGPASAP